MNGSGVSYRAMAAGDYPLVRALWESTPGMGLDPQMDSAVGISAYLQKNPGMSFIALGQNGQIAGTVLAGTDGRRGYLMHLAVQDAYRRRGIGRNLVERSLAALQAAGITKAHVFVFQDNALGSAFWRGLGWQGRDDLLMLSLSLNEDSPKTAPNSSCC